MPRPAKTKLAPRTPHGNRARAILPVPSRPRLRPPCALRWLRSRAPWQCACASNPSLKCHLSLPTPVSRSYCDTATLAADSVINLTASTQTHFKVGVLAIRGFPAAVSEFNETFGTYLTCEMKCRYNPPVTFEMVPLNFKTLFTSIPTKEVDFIYVNPSAYSCIESEFGAASLVSQIGYQKIGNERVEIQEFGGVIFTLAGRDDINSLEDIKDKSYAAASISGLGSGM